MFGKATFDDPSTISFAARRSNGDEDATVLQHSWAACVRTVAKALDAAEFSHDALLNPAKTLSNRVREPQSIAEFQDMFAVVGVKLVYIDSFPGGKLDGCAMVVDGHPVIGLSGRGKRLDKVFFTLLHEIAPILLVHLAI